MKTPKYKVKIGIVGCGAIGSRMAKSISNELKKDCKLTGIFDLDTQKTKKLEKQLKRKKICKSSVAALIKSSDCVIEAVNAQNTHEIIRDALKAKKSVLAMSVGKLLNSQSLFQLAKKNKCYILLPSGAIAGVDAVKAASLAKITKITLTTRKPLSGFRDNAYLQSKGIKLNRIKRETTLFRGNVTSAVKHFPQNINVAATLALASQHSKNFVIKIITSPKYRKNSHEITVEGDFGKMRTLTENVVCPDNPKSSYLAVLSGLQTLKQYCTGILIGT